MLYLYADQFPLYSDLLHCTNEPNVSIPTLANLLIERTQNPNWVVVFKGLITTHHLMCYGNEVSWNNAAHDFLVDITHILVRRVEWNKGDG